MSAVAPVRRPAVSVLMPVYNGQRYLREAVESILNQSLRDFEFIIVDDGSTDATPAILSEYRDPRLRVIRTSHRGLIPALNSCVKESTGEFLARMDSDDVSLPERLEKQLEAMMRDTELAVLTSRVELIDETGAVVGEHPEFSPDRILLELAGGNPIVHGSVMMRRKSLPDPVYDRAPEDFCLWIRLAREGRKFGLVPEVLYRFRHHERRYSILQASRQSRGNVLARWPLLVECEQLYDLSDPLTRKKIAWGWLNVVASAYCAGMTAAATVATRQLNGHLRFLDNGSVAELARYAVDALGWSGAPRAAELRFRLMAMSSRPQDVMFIAQTLRRLADWAGFE